MKREGGCLIVNEEKLYTAAETEMYRTGGRERGNGRGGGRFQRGWGGPADQERGRGIQQRPVKAGNRKLVQQDDSSFIFEDSFDLPYGWSRIRKKRLNSATYDRCILTSCGTRIDRQKKLDNFISAKDLDLNISFSGSGRKILATAPVTIENQLELLQ